MTGLSAARFAVVDVETTGLFPRTDRIIEVAVLNINAAGDVLQSFETLVNPDSSTSDKAQSLRQRHKVSPANG